MPLVCGSALAPTSAICYRLHLGKHIKQGEMEKIMFPFNIKDRLNFDAFNVLRDQLQNSLQIQIVLLSSFQISGLKWI